MNIIKPSYEYIEILTKTEFEGINSSIKDGMAIPSYNHKNPLIRWLMWKRYEMIFKIANLDNTKVVYEFGCGIGLFLPTLFKYSKKVYATDIYPQFAKKLSHDYNLDISFVDSIEQINEDLDIIICADVLEHIQDIKPIILKWHKKLKKDGKLIISGPTENFLYKIGRFIAGFSGKGDYHVHNIKDILETIKSNGYILKTQKSLPTKLLELFRILGFTKA